MAKILPKTTFKDWSKDPKTGVMLLMGSLLTIFVYAFVSSKNENDSDCKQQLIVWQQLYMNEKSINDSFKMQIISQNETQNEMVELVDSILKNKTNKPVQNILKIKK